MQSGDLETVSTPIDLLGVNYYTSSVYSGVDEHGRTEDADGRAIERVVPRGLPTTAMGWEIFRQGLTDLLVRITRDCPGLPIVITENGARRWVWSSSRRSGRLLTMPVPIDV